ncbi:P-glycoprotein 6, putative [Entamoeba histolytica HM-1:IMSS]|uniref:p-glycoprotein 6, putative n=1 Tax=Entamoeba histolytica (strain ATCC 30459 / HM-1:IMSS / ABRM) TaxID=294381 RepID=B1N3U1_ENTH1|nr:P-glycoprotein 6, putative [Entamoeba histolytica HM-1:IMSS]EDS89368.1 P-glycoprotein 6, putative [Entamoeba histolytica HM-1:IMSS]|eukprot:XP_001913855.1 P-glycoprotein 6, putative [Entamoeba histolytica HM-1:IMSS]
MSTSVNTPSNPGVEMQLLTDGFDIFDVTPDPNNLMAAAPRTTDKGSVSIFMMFKYATWIEIIFNIIGVLISLCDGVLYPLIAILIGDVFDSKAFNPLAYDVAEIENLCNKTSLKFMYIGIGLFFTSLIRTIIFDITGGNQIRRIRRLYIKSLLDQEMGWYDAHNSGEMTSRMSGDIFLLHDAIGQKVGEFFSYFGMCITGYVIGFVKEWKLCFVMISVAPFMVGAAGIFAYVQTRTASSTQASYSVAGGIASETISNMRTVAALGIEKSRIHQYLQTLRHSLHVGIRASHETGGSTGLLFFFVFCAFWIGYIYVIQLIERFYKPEKGTVKINGRNIQEFNLATLRNKIGYVGQEPLLFAGTIGENIVSGMCGSWTDDQLENGGNLVAENMDKIVAAAKMANCHNFICQLPQGYNTIIGERGTSLSGGQKQRIAIARALITQPELLILDEATSALDSESEMIVQQAIDKIAKQVTSIVIAHRLSTVKDSDIIVVLSGGKVVEQGTHDELMKEEGVYFHLVQIQAQ